MARSGNAEFIYLIKIVDDQKEKYYLKTTIDEQHHSILIHLSNFKQSWTGVVNQDQVRTLAKKFPTESKDSFYSHTQRAFSKGNKAEADGRSYVFNCKKLDRNRLEFIWKEKVDALNSLKTIGTAELEERPNDEVLSKIMDYTIEEMDTLRSANEQKRADITRIDGQLQQALETVKRTVDIKEQLEADLYRKFVLVLNAKKIELAKLKDQLDTYEHDNPRGSRADNGSYPDTLSPMHTEPSTLTEIDSRSGKRRRHDSNDSNGSDNEVMEEVRPAATRPKMHAADSALDLGNDQRDYKSSTPVQHHQRRKPVTGTNTISTRPFANNTVVSSTMTLPSLPDDSQTTDDLLNKL